MKQIASEASEEETKDTQELVRRATGAGESAEVIILTPMEALLFLDHNTHNRAWKLAKIREWQRLINLGAWKFNSNGAGFYTTGAIADGQHRLAAHALCGTSWKVTVTFGVTRTRPTPWTAADCAAATTRPTSNTTSRSPSLSWRSSARLIPIMPPWTKKDESFKLRANAEKGFALKENDAMLSEAIELGKAFARGVTNPQFTAKDASTEAFILLKVGSLSSEKILEHLQRFQTGVIRLGENEAQFAAAKYITDSRSKVAKGKEKAEKLSALREYGVVVAAILAAENGVVPTAANLRAAVAKGKPLPDPRPYVEVEEQEAAE